MNQPLLEDQANPGPTNAERFSAMAMRLLHNEKSTFGGAFVIVPPGNGGIPLEALILDNQGSAAQFYMVLQARIATELAKLQDAERNIGGFPRGR